MRETWSNNQRILLGIYRQSDNQITAITTVKPATERRSARPLPKVNTITTREYVHNLVHGGQSLIFHLCGGGWQTIHLSFSGGQRSSPIFVEEKAICRFVGDDDVPRFVGAKTYTSICGGTKIQPGTTRRLWDRHSKSTKPSREATTEGDDIYTRKYPI